MEAIDYEVKDKVALVTLKRPDKFNAINLQMRIELTEALHDIKYNPDIWVAVFTGEGKAFSSGEDLKERGLRERGQKLEIPAGTMDATDMYIFLKSLYKPTICAINGICFAQGAGLALSTDIRFASREKAQIGWPQVKVGISSISGPSLLPQMIPLNLALELLYTGKNLNAEEARTLGIVNRVVPHENLMNEVHQFVAQIIKNAPIPMRLNKEVAVRGANMSIEDRSIFGRSKIFEARQTQDSKEGVAAFLEKREPVWKGC